MGGIEAPLTSPAPGWYPDPAGGGALRWWDGHAWTGHLNAPWGMPTGGEPAKTSRHAIASLVLGLTGVGPLAIVFGVLALRSIRRSEARLGGRIMAIAGIVLGVLGSLLAALIIALASSGAFDEDTNAERFTGAERKIAFLIDRHEQLAEDEEFETMCTDLYTPALEEAIASEAGRSCPAELADELADTFVVDTEVREIEIRGTNATATYEEAGDPGTFYLVEQDGRWLIDAIE